jgi:hypothetical protein
VNDTTLNTNASNTVLTAFERVDSYLAFLPSGKLSQICLTHFCCADKAANITDT